MLEVDEEDPEWLTMTGADDGGVNARTAMKTTKAVKLRSEGTTQLQLNVDAATRVHRYAEEGASQHYNNQWRWTTGNGRRHCNPRGRCSGNPKLDGVVDVLKDDRQKGVIVAGRLNG
uniref:Uncharacterized protein n=1 Tax=Oryza punctata TaxID=4537 RepID=A0A0E0JW66_ORYPU